MRLMPVIFLLLTFLFPIEAVIAEPPPKFWIKSMEGKRFNSKKQKSAFVVSFFFVNCAPCIKEIPLLHKFMSTSYPNIPLLFIDPIKEDSKKDIKKFSKKLNVPLSYFYKDSFGSISKKFFKGRMAFPTIVGNKNKNDLVNTSNFKIDLSQFNSTMDRLARSYSTSKKVTEFERKVGNSVCRVAELTMSDLQARPKKPKFRFQTILLLPTFFEGMIMSANTIQTTNSG